MSGSGAAKYDAEKVQENFDNFRCGRIEERLAELDAEKAELTAKKAAIAERSKAAASWDATPANPMKQVGLVAC